MWETLLCVVATIVCAYAPNIEVLLLGRFLQGVTGSFGVVISKAIARDHASGPALIKLLASLMMVNGLAPVIAPLVGGQILAYETWRFNFRRFLAGFAILLLVGSILFRESLPTEQRVAGGIQEAIKNYKMLLKDKAFLGQCGIQCICFWSLLLLH